MLPLLKQEITDTYTYADLLEWDDDTRWELYDGEPIAMSSPSDVHQEISGELHLQLGTYLKGKKCKVYYAPFDVRLFERKGDRPENVKTVVQPDLMVVCDTSKIDRRGIHGAPDLVIEILSDSTRRNDRLLKFNLYREAGVKEYWIIDPVDRMVSVHVLENGQYYTTVYEPDASIPVSVLEDCTIDLSSVFPEEETN